MPVLEIHRNYDNVLIIDWKNIVLKRKTWMKNLNEKKQEDLGDTPFLNKRKTPVTPPTPFQTETRSKRASVAMRMNQPIN